MATGIRTWNAEHVFAVRKQAPLNPGFNDCFLPNQRIRGNPRFPRVYVYTGNRIELGETPLQQKAKQEESLTTSFYK